MANGFVRYAEPADCEAIAKNMRPEDVAEVWASNRHSPLEALTVGYLQSNPPMTIIKNPDIPVGMFGSVPMSFGQPSSAGIWMLGTNEIWDVRFQFLRESRHWLEEVSKEYDLVYNVIDKRNELHIRWLKWLGFHLVREIPDFGPDEIPFIEFVRI